MKVTKLKIMLMATLSWMHGYSVLLKPERHLRVRLEQQVESCHLRCDKPQEDEGHSSICPLSCQPLVKVPEGVLPEVKTEETTPEGTLMSLERRKGTGLLSGRLNRRMTVDLRSMSTSARAWIPRDRRLGQQCLQDMTEGSLPDVGQVNAREGVREEKWVALDLRTTKFPPTQTSSVRRATLIQNFEADFIRAMGIISPSAALYAQAVIAGVQQDLRVYRKRDDRTTARDWTKKLPEEQWHSRAEAVVNLQLQHIGISQECWDLARMLRHNPPVRLILMTAYHRLLPARSREEDDLHQYVKDPVAGDQGAVSTFQKLQLWNGGGSKVTANGRYLARRDHTDERL